MLVRAQAADAEVPALAQQEGARQVLRRLGESASKAVRVEAARTAVALRIAPIGERSSGRLRSRQQQQQQQQWQQQQQAAAGARAGAVHAGGGAAAVDDDDDDAAAE